LLWHLADRWGQVSGEGIRLNLDLTHELIARMVGAHRTSVTLALRRLTQEGRLARTRRTWVLLGPPPEEISDAARARGSAARR
jgi:DNA-binding GntR family transcriptional regulator